jgi:hypothetical protein
MKTSTKIWLGVGAFVVAGTGGVATEPATAEILTPGTQRAPMDARVPVSPRTSTSAIVLAQHARHGGEGGEGEGGEGEGGERGGAKHPPELRFGLRIAQLRGHLVVGDQLVKAGQWKAALPHFLHPTEEIYGSIRRQLKAYGVPPFDAALKVLADTVKRRKAGADYDKAMAAVQAALAKADAGLKAKEANWPTFTVELTLELLKSAAGEYEEAVVKGRIAKPVEYQDARGFVWQAESMLSGVADELGKKNADALKRVQEHIAELKTVFPAPTPPKQPVKDHADVLAMIAQVELAAGPLM